VNEHATTRLSPIRQTVDVVTAGKMLGLGRSAAYRAAARGDIPSLRIGGKVLVPLVRLAKLLEGEE
jgi:Helix-turn-helix domain